jgi:hypothetical protein
MFWKTFFAVLAALTVFALLVLGVMAMTSYAAREDLRRQMADYKRESAAQADRSRQERELREHQAKLHRAVCRHGQYYVPRRSGNVTYFDPLEWRGALVRCGDR